MIVFCCFSFTTRAALYMLYICVSRGVIIIVQVDDGEITKKMRETYSYDYDDRSWDYHEKRLVLCLVCTSS